MDVRDAKLLAAILVAVAVVVAGWYFRDVLQPKPEQPVVTLAEPASVEESVEDGPAHPISPLDAAESTPEKPIPLPSLDESDSYFLLALVDLFGDDIKMLLVKNALIDKFVATVDNLPRDHVAEKVRPLRRLSGTFRADVAGSDEPIYLSPENFQQYDLLVRKIAAADIDAVVSTYRRSYPLFQQSYERLGYPNGHFNDRVIEVIDHLLATPQPDEPIQLIRPNVLYEYANPELENRSSGQKLMLRVGSDHAATVKRVLRELRAELAHQ